MFYLQSSHSLRSVQYAYCSKTMFGLIMLYDSVQFLMEIRTISRRRWRSPDFAKLGHFTLLFCRGRLRSIQGFITLVHSHCCAHYTFCLVTFSLLKPSWFEGRYLKLNTKSGFELGLEPGLGKTRIDISWRFI